MKASEKATLFTTVESFKRSTRGKCIENFFMGMWYPIIVAALVTIGHICNVEFYTNILNFLLISFALLICDTLRPFVMFAIAFIYQVTVDHAPGNPTFSDYYFTSWRLVVMIALILIVALAMVYFLIANKCFLGLGFKSVPFLFPLCVLSLGFLTNGVFSGKWMVVSLVYGISQVAIFAFVLLIFYLGLRREKGDEILSYFSYASMLLAIVLILELANVYATGNVIVDGSAVKENVVFGWGCWNSVGASLVVLIPVCFIGVLRSKYSALCFAVATLSYIAAVFSLSRNALLWGTVVYCVCAVISCFAGRYKRIYRIIVAVGALAVLVGIFVLWDKIAVILSDFLSRGLSDNGRFELWRTGIEDFLSAPIFGTGFFNYVSDTFLAAEFLPKLAHQTIIQLLSCTGAFGLVAYLYYRGATVIPFVKKPTVDKTLLFMSVAAIIAMTFIDVFLFYFLHTIHYDIAIAIGFIIYEQQCAKEADLKSLS